MSYFDVKLEVVVGIESEERGELAGYNGIGREGGNEFLHPALSYFFKPFLHFIVIIGLNVV